MASPAPRRYVPDRATFLEFLETQEQPWEFVGGFVMPKAMVGGTVAHNRIARNVTRLLEDAVGDGPCVVFQDGMRLDPAHGHDVTFPDVMVVCEPVSDGATSVSRPTVIVEVLSRGTAWSDRGPKWDGYQGIPSLRHYVMIGQSKPAIEVYSRADEAEVWAFRRFVELEAIAALDAVGARLPLRDVYRGTDLVRGAGG